MPEEEYADKTGPEREGQPSKGETEGGGMQADSEHEATYESMDNDPIDEYEMASLSCRAELITGGELCSTLSCPMSPVKQGCCLPPCRGR